MITFVHTWRTSAKLWSQRISGLIAAIGTTYAMLTPNMREDLGETVITAMAVLGGLNLLVRNIKQTDITVETTMDKPSDSV